MTITTDTQFSTRTAPWMKLGELVEEPQSAAEAAKLGGLDFTVSKQKAGWYDPNTRGWKRVNHRTAVVRDDTGEVFEYVGNDYQLLQYAEAFDFMDQIHPRYVAAGSLRNGRQGFLVVQPEKLVSPGEDRTEMFVVLRTSHDRSRAIEVAIMPLRYKCMNQLTLRSFMKGVPHRWSIHHTTKMQEKLAQAHKSMAQLDEYTTAFNRLAEKLMSVRPTEDHARQLLNKVIINGGQKRDQVIEQIIDLWHNDTVTVDYNDTAWGLVNATSDYLDWRKTRGTPESRFLLALQGYTHRAINTVAGELLRSSQAR